MVISYRIGFLGVAKPVVRLAVRRSVLLPDPARTDQLYNRVPGSVPVEVGIAAPGHAERVAAGPPARVHVALSVARELSVTYSATCRVW